MEFASEIVVVALCYDKDPELIERCYRLVLSRCPVE